MADHAGQMDQPPVRIAGAAAVEVAQFEEASQSRQWVVRATVAAQAKHPQRPHRLEATARQPFEKLPVFADQIVERPLGGQAESRTSG